MPTTDLFVVASASVAKRVSRLSARFYPYKKQITAGNMDPMSRVSVDATHPAVTAARRRSAKAATACETPPTRTSPPHLAKAKSTTTRSAGLACSGASSLARTGAASARSSSMGSESASGSNLNLPAEEPPLSVVSEDEDEDDNDDGSEMIIGNLFPHGPGVGGGGGCW